MPVKTGAATSRERILQSAKHLFAVRGYENTSTIMIARQAGTSESQMVKHFGSKDGLLEAIFEQGWTALGNIFETLDCKLSGVEQLRYILLRLLEGLDNDPDLRELMMLESRRVRKQGQALLLTRGFLEFVQKLDAFLAQMQARGELRANLRPAAVRSALLGMGEGLMRDQLLAKRAGAATGYDDDDIREILDTVLASLITPQGSKATSV